MPNTNCLEGFICPKCGSDRRFKIEVTALMYVVDDGTESHEDTEWGNNSYCECTACHHCGKVIDFDEVARVSFSKRKELPLLISTLKTEAGQVALKERLSNG